MRLIFSFVLAMTVSLFVTGCAAPSTILMNQEGNAFRCAAVGGGLIGVVAASMAHDNCVTDAKKMGFIEVPPVIWGCNFDPASSRLKIKTAAPNSPAGLAGITPGDVLVELDGKTVNTFAEVMEILANKKDGDALQAKFERFGNPITLTSILRNR